ncbi:hypothetical protein ABFG93_17490 [Pseudalkalibacillus hwajinpoensis]|uniref:hypothetical protein n=1 Tax=Guptibacillus hwajinpoensis TaxID=208199 RepID=UPI00325B5DEE
MVKNSIWIVILVCLLSMHAHAVKASSLENSFSFKCMVMVNGVEHEWEFSSPNEFEVESGREVVKGEKAEREVIALFQHLQVTELARAEDLVKSIKSYGFDDVERFELKWMDASGRLYTWVWDEVDE